MNLFLPTLPAFLRKNFPRTRERLGGVGYSHEFSVNHGAAKHSSVMIFTGDDAVGEEDEFRLAKPLVGGGLFKQALGAMLTTITFGSILVGVFLFVPAAYYAFFPADVIEVQAPEEGTAFGGSFEELQVEVEEEKYIPPVDPTLPEGDWLIIPRIGVRTQLRDTEDPEEALAKGVWWVPDFGKPGDEELPMIAAAHRYGWKWWWKDDYWKYHSFYLLPDTEPGDRIEVISGQRKWEYEIYAGEEGDEITDYNADLILYTCKFISGPVRHFRYARLIDPTTNTQAANLN